MKKITTERLVLELIRKHYPLAKIKKLTLDSTFNQSMRMAWEDVDDLMDEYFKNFNINSDHFSLIKYFPNEGTLFIPNFLIRKSLRPTGQKAVPLTVRMLLKSSKAGR